MKLISVALCTLSVAHAGGHGVYSFEQECRTGKCPLTTGPATCVAVGHTGQGSTCLLTAAHCVESSANLFFAVGKTGSRYAAKVVYRNERLDIAALLVHEKLSLAPVRLTVPSPGDMVFLSGLLSRRLEESAGYLDRVDNEGRIWCRNVWSHSGMSGGAMTDEDGRLFAIHNAHTDRARTLSGPIKPAIQEFEKRHGRLRFAPDSLITQQGYCQPCQYRSRSVTRSYCPAPQTPSPSAPVTVSVSVNYKGCSKQFFAQYGNE